MSRDTLSTLAKIALLQRWEEALYSLSVHALPLLVTCWEEINGAWGDYHVKHVNALGKAMHFMPGTEE